MIWHKFSKTNKDDHKQECNICLHSKVHMSDAYIWPECHLWIQIMHVAKKEWAMWVASSDSSAKLMAPHANYSIWSYPWECNYLILQIWVSLCLKQQPHNILISFLCCNIEGGSPILHEVMCVYGQQWKSSDCISNNITQEHQGVVKFTFRTHESTA